MIANSNAVATSWRSLVEPLSGSPVPITTVPNGVDLEEFRPRTRSFAIRDRLGLPRDAFVFGMPAVFASWKGQLEVVEAFQMAQASMPEAFLLLVGGSIYDTTAEHEYRSEINARLERVSDGRVLATGFMSDVANAYGEFDCTLHYSLRPEPFGRVVIESMASGVPIIAAARGGPVEILGSPTSGVAEGGWLCEPGRPDELARMLVSVYERPSHTLQKIGLQGRRRAEALFGAERYAEAVARVLQGTVT